MALKDILSLIDDKLADTFHLKAYDPERDREKLVARLNATRTKFLATEPARGRKDFRVANNVVEFSPTLPNGEPMILGDKQPPYYVPSERFTDMIDNLVKLTTEKAFDGQLEGKAAPAGTKRQKSTTARKPRSDAGAGWSPERRARFDATVAARKAAKGQ